MLYDNTHNEYFKMAVEILKEDGFVIMYKQPVSTEFNETVGKEIAVFEDKKCYAINKKVEGFEMLASTLQHNSNDNYYHLLIATKDEIKPNTKFLINGKYKVVNTVGYILYDPIVSEFVVVLTFKV